MQRRSFLAGMLAACAAPAVVKASSLMKIVAPAQSIWLPTTDEWGYGARKPLHEWLVNLDKWYTPPELEVTACPIIITSDSMSYKLLGCNPRLHERRRPSPHQNAEG